MSNDVRDQLEIYGLSSDLGGDAVFGSVGEAVEAHRASLAPAAPSIGTGSDGDGPPFTA